MSLKVKKYSNLIEATYILMYFDAKKEGKILGGDY